MTHVRLAWIALIIVTLATVPALAHHGWSSYDAGKEMTLDGVIKESGYEHPHGHIRLDELRRLWLPISPQHYLEKLRGRTTRTLLVYARYDLTFPVDLSRDLVRAFRAHGVPYQLSVLPCGHYSTGAAPFKYMDGAVLTRFLHEALR